MATTIRDVASRAGVSIATVSRALRDADSVTAETRARVTRAAADLDYVPSQLGRQLAERRHAANGIVFPDLSGPYFAEVVLGYEAAAAELDHAVLILSTHGRDDADALASRLAARTDGLVVLAGTVSDALVQRLVGRGTPVVLVARKPVDGADSVNAENTSAAARLAHHLVDSGAQTIRFVGDPTATTDAAERYESLAATAGARAPTSRSRSQQGSARTPASGWPPTPSPAQDCPTPSPAPTTSWPSACGSDYARPASPCPTTPSSPAGTT